jgi:hypothetical protein
MREQTIWRDHVEAGLELFGEPVFGGEDGQRDRENENEREAKRFDNGNSMQTMSNDECRTNDKAPMTKSNTPQ